MVKEVAYTPITEVKETIINAPKEIDKPEYDDKGVSFKGYSKTLLGNNQYQLNPQERADPNYILTYGGGETNSSLNRTNRDSKDFYVQDIFISSWRIAGSVPFDYITISDGNSIRVAFNETAIEITTHYLSFHFTTPLKFTKGNNINLTFSAARGAGDATTINFWGWEE